MCRVAPCRLLAIALTLWAATPLAAGTFTVRTATSPADGATISYGEYLPTGYPGTRTWPLVVSLHGRSGSLSSNASSAVRTAADARGYVFIFYDGRAVSGQTGRSSYYVDCRNAPDETDVLAILDATLGRLAIDPERVYLTGGSMGGKGTWGIGLRNPDRFAALGPAMGPTDAFWANAQNNAGSDFVDAAGGAYGSSPRVDAMWFVQSPRFYTENARNLPVFVGHGDLDPVVPNTDAFGRYHHSRHIVDDPSFSDDRGHTPTLGELRAADGGGYEHRANWVATAGHQYQTVLPVNDYLAFFEGRRRPASPRRVAYTAYDAAWRARRAYWVSLGAQPDVFPVRVLAESVPATNTLALQLTAGAVATVDLAAAGLSGSQPLLLRLSARTGQASGTATVRLTGSFPSGLTVTRDGQLVLFERLAGGLELGPLPLGAEPATYVLSDVLQLALVAPNGGESFAEGSRVAVSWTPSPLLHVTAYRLLYSRDGGATYAETLTPVLPASVLSLTVALPCGTTDAARLRLEALSGTQPVLSDESDGTFRVTAAPGCGAVSQTDLVIPGAASLDGANGARWTTEAILANRGPAPLRVRAMFHGVTRSARPIAPVAIWDLAPGASLTVDDCVAELAEPGTAGAVSLRVEAGEPSWLLAGGRTATPAGGGSFGFFLPGEAPSGSIPKGESAIVFGAADAAARTNVGLFALETGEALVELLGPSGELRRSYTESLAAGEWRQLSDLGSDLTVRVTAQARWQAYATVVSNSASNDPQGGLALGTSSASAELFVPAVASAPGAQGAYFRSDLALFAPGSGGVRGRIAFTHRGASEPAGELAFALAPGATLRVRDVVLAILPTDSPASGSLRITADAPVLATSVTSTDGPLGLAGQGFPAFRRDHAIAGGASADAAGLAEDERFRTNLVLLNLGTTAADALLTATGADGTAMGDSSVPVPANGSVQLDRVLRLFTGGSVSGVRLTVRASGQPLLAVASKLDNVTNDPTAIPFTPR